MNLNNVVRRFTFIIKQSCFKSFFFNCNIYIKSFFLLRDNNATDVDTYSRQYIRLARVDSYSIVVIWRAQFIVTEDIVVLLPSTRLARRHVIPITQPSRESGWE